MSQAVEAKTKQQEQEEQWNSPQARAARKILKCRVQLGNKQPFFGNLIMHLKVEEKLGMPFKTMATDGRHLFYDPDFVLEHSEDEIKWTICHEVMHCALKHFLRRQANPDYWNTAADYALNQLIGDLPEECGKQVEHTLGSPQDENKDHNGKLIKEVVVGWTAEMIYQYLLTHNIDLPPDWVTGKGGGKCTWRIGEVEDPPPPPPGAEPGEGAGEEKEEGDGMKVVESDLSDPERLSDYWDDALKDSLSKNAGTLPENFRRKLLRLLQPQVDWKSALRRFIIALGERHKYDIPHRRFIGNDDIQWTRTPTKSTFDSFVLIADTSGSIGQKELTGMVSEAYQIMKDFKPKQIHLMWCDAALHLPVDIVTKSTMHLLHAPRGGGGTDFRPPFKWIKENLLGKKTLGPIIYFTDGYGPFPTDKEFGIPYYKDKVIWVIVGTKGYMNTDVKIPFGTRLNLVL